MKFNLLLAFCLGFLTLSYGQKDINDIKVYNVWSSYEGNGKWSEWKNNDEVFILNFNNSEDIARCRLNNTIIIYKRDFKKTPIKISQTSEGYKYKEIVVNPEDNFMPYTYRFYENNPNYGLELTVGGVRIRFAKK